MEERVMNSRKGAEAVVVAVAVEVVDLSSSNRVEATKVVVVEVGLPSSSRLVEAKDVEVMEVAVEISVAEWPLSSTMEVHPSKCISRVGEHHNNSSVMEGLSTIRCKAGDRSNNSSTLNSSSSTLNSTNKQEDHHHKAEVVAKEDLYLLLVDLLGHLAPTYTKLSRLHDKQRR